VAYHRKSDTPTVKGLTVVLFCSVFMPPRTINFSDKFKNKELVTKACAMLAKIFFILGLMSSESVGVSSVCHTSLF